MTKVLAGVLAAALLALAGSGYLLHRQTEKVGGLSAKVSVLEQSVLDANREVERRDAVSTMFDKLISDLNGTKAENQAAFAKVQKAIREIPRSEGDTNESFICLDTPIPAALDSLLRGDPAANTGDQVPGGAR